MAYLITACIFDKKNICTGLSQIYRVEVERIKLTCDNNNFVTNNVANYT